MAQKITEGALVQCDKGVKPSKLKVSSQDFCQAEGKLIATEEDKQAEVNVPNFGICTVTRSKCVPSIIKWDNPTSKDEINGFKILTEASTCQCAVGGKIVVQHKGHNEKHDAS